MNDPPQLPAWVRKRDGRTEPFDADKINRALFAAGAELGQPDAFVARELTDGVLHFLAQEATGSQIASAEIKELLVKVVRELGRPQLSRALVDFTGKGQLPRATEVAEDRLGPPTARVQQWLEAGEASARLVRRCGAATLAAYSLEHVFSKNLVAAHQAGLLVLGGLEEPLEVAGAVILPALPHPTGRAPAFFEIIEQARTYVGGTLALDAPERLLAQWGVRVSEAAAFLRELRLAARSTGLQVVLNLGCETPPEWAEEGTESPLFEGPRWPESVERVLGHLDALVDQALSQPWTPHLHLHWHLAGRDFDNDDGRRRLLRLARAALQGAAITFCCDRPRRPISLAEGLDRRHKAVSQWVGLSLPALLQRLGAEATPDVFVAKLTSLTRLAASAGVQKRDFLRRHARSERPTFLIEQAHLGLHLLGLPAVLRQLHGGAHGQSDEALAFAQRVCRGVQETLDAEARQISVSGFLDSAPAAVEGDHVEELPSGSWKGTLRAEGRLHAVTGRGTLVLCIPEEHTPDAEEVLDALHYGWKQTGVSRLRFTRRRTQPEQLTVPWGE